MHFLQSVDCLEYLANLIRFGHAPGRLNIHQRPALPGHPVEQMAAPCSRLSEVVAAGSSRVVEPDVPKVSPHILQRLVHE